MTDLGDLPPKKGVPGVLIASVGGWWPSGRRSRPTRVIPAFLADRPSWGILGVLRAWGWPWRGRLPHYGCIRGAVGPWPRRGVAWCSPWYRPPRGLAGGTPGPADGPSMPYPVPLAAVRGACVRATAKERACVWAWTRRGVGGGRGAARTVWSPPASGFFRSGNQKSFFGILKYGREIFTLFRRN